jgi:hypothetical protein
MSLSQRRPSWPIGDHSAGVQMGCERGREDVGPRAVGESLGAAVTNAEYLQFVEDTENEMLAYLRNAPPASAERGKLV